MATNSRSPTIRRILREAAEISSSPSPDFTAEPLESDLFEWHFTLRGPPNSPYSEGIYHGRIVLPAAYPLRPPSFRFMTPNGRFEANREICLSISGHHEETWQPAWGIRTAIVALRSFMETSAAGQLGGFDTTEAVRKRLASESPRFKCSTCGKTNGEIIKECENLAKETEGSGEEVHVPDELNLGFRDEMEAKKKAAADVKASEEQEESAQLAEGFVQTVPISPDRASANIASAATDSNDSVAPRPLRPAQTVPQPTGLGTQAPMQVAQPQVAIAGPRRASDEGIPIWIDRLIVVLVVLLGAVVLKILFGF